MRLKRIQHLRKDILKMTQEEFAYKINISRSNLANIEKGIVNLTERVIADICRVFYVNREWIIDGKNPIFTNGNSAELFEIINTYEKLNDENKKYLQGYIHRLLEEQRSNNK